MSECPSAKNGEGNIVNDEGWVCRFTTSKDRLEEFKILFAEMGEEVRITPINVNDFSNNENCDTCLIECGEDLRTVWTRKISRQDEN